MLTSAHGSGPSFTENPKHIQEILQVPHALSLMHRDFPLSSHILWDYLGLQSNTSLHQTPLLPLVSLLRPWTMTNVKDQPALVLPLPEFLLYHSWPPNGCSANAQRDLHSLGDPPRFLCGFLFSTVPNITLSRRNTALDVLFHKLQLLTVMPFYLLTPELGRWQDAQMLPSLWVLSRHYPSSQLLGTVSMPAAAPWRQLSHSALCFFAPPIETEQQADHTLSKINEQLNLSLINTKRLQAMKAKLFYMMNWLGKGNQSTLSRFSTAGPYCHQGWRDKAEAVHIQCWDWGQQRLLETQQTCLPKAAAMVDPTTTRDTGGGSPGRLHRFLYLHSARASSPPDPARSQLTWALEAAPGGPELRKKWAWLHSNYVWVFWKTSNSPSNAATLTPV